MKLFGGYIERPGSMKGMFLFANCSKLVDNALIEECLPDLRKYFAVNYAVTNCVFSGIEAAATDMRTMKAGAVVFIVDEKTLPSVLFSPEENWGLVNARSVARGFAGEVNEAFRERMKREIYRAFMMTAGGTTSQFPMNIMTSHTIADIDAPSRAFMPVDMIQRIMDYLPRIGITPVAKVTYATACKEGWAPKPQNEHQQRIWDKVHQLPATPMKIEFDPKKGK